MGLRLRIASNVHAIIEAARASFGGYGPPPEDGRAPDLVVELLTHDLPNEPAPPLYRARGPLVYASLGAANAAVLDLGAGRAFGFVTPALAADSIALRVYLLEALFYSFLQHAPVGGRAHTGFVGMHGACVLPPDQQSGMMLRAHSGVGKSVLAYACLQRGFRLLAEDVTWLELREGQLLAAWGAPWLLHLRPEAVALFPELKRYGVYSRPTGVAKLALPLPELFPAQLATRAPLAALCFLARHAGHASQLEPLAPAAAQALLRATEGEELDAPRYEAGLAALLRYPAYLFHVGADLDTAVRMLGALAAPAHMDGRLT
jgi:hypothetical protein